MIYEPRTGDMYKLMTVIITYMYTVLFILQESKLLCSSFSVTIGMTAKANMSIRKINACLCPQNRLTVGVFYSMSIFGDRAFLI